MPRYNSLGEALGGALQNFAPQYLQYKLGQRDRADRLDRENRDMDLRMADRAWDMENRDRTEQRQNLSDRLQYEREDRNRMMDFETEQMKLRNRPEAQLSETEVIGKYLQDNPGVLESLLGARIDKMNRPPAPKATLMPPDIVGQSASKYRGQFNMNPANTWSTKPNSSLTEATNFYDTQVRPRIPALQEKYGASFGANAPDSLRGGLMAALGYGQAPKMETDSASGGQFDLESWGRQTFEDWDTLSPQEKQAVAQKKGMLK